MKVIRWLLMYKQGAREVQRLVHPSAEIPVKLGGRGVRSRVVDSVWGFFAIYIVVFAVLMLIMLSTELDAVSAFAAVASTLNNLGPGLGVALAAMRGQEHAEAVEGARLSCFDGLQVDLLGVVLAALPRHQ